MTAGFCPECGASRSLGRTACATCGFAFAALDGTIADAKQKRRWANPGLSRPELAVIAMIGIAVIVGALVIVRPLGEQRELADPGLANQVEQPTPSTEPERTKPSASPAPAAVDGSLGDEVCALTADLNRIQNDHVYPMTGAMLEDLDLEDTQLRQQVYDHAAAVAGIFLANAGRVQALHSPSLAPLIVLIENSYAAYGEGVTALKQELDAGYGPRQEATGPLADGYQILEELNSEIQLLEAAGSLSCTP